jgi:glucose/mannose-6-phosphate isomerase
MGGSAIPGEIISMLWLNGFICYLNRGFGLPNWVNDKCLVICTSWSGNTEETISSFNEAIARGLPVVAIADKGELLDLAKKHGTPFVDLPARSEPARFVVGQMLSAILTLLFNSAIIDNTLPIISKKTVIGDDPIRNSSSSNGASFSSRIGDKIPLIYSSYQWRYLARFWKIHFNENCKIHAFSNFLPEAAHNEISGFTEKDKDKYFPIILMDEQEENADIKKLEKFAAFLKDQNIDHEIVRIEGKDRLDKILNSYNRAITVSVGLAETNGVEPFDTAVIEKFKRS